MEYNFKLMGDAELLRMKTILTEELEARLIQMKLDPEIQILQNQLEEIESEEEERDL